MRAAFGDDDSDGDGAAYRPSATFTPEQVLRRLHCHCPLLLKYTCAASPRLETPCVSFIAVIGALQSMLPSYRFMNMCSQASLRVLIVMLTLILLPLQNETHRGAFTCCLVCDVRTFTLQCLDLCS